MAQSQHLSLRQSQRLVLAPQLRQALALLQLNNLDLAQQVAAEIETNPLLSMGDVGDPAESETGVGPSDRAKTGVQVPEDSSAGRPSWSRHYGSVHAPAASSSASTMDALGGGGARAASLEAVDLVASHVELRQHLLSQAALNLRDPVDLELACAIVDQLDDAGYVTTDLAVLAAEVGCPEDRASALLARLQQLDRPGLFARSLQECLALQLVAKDRLSPAMSALLAHLELLAEGNFERLVGLCGVDEAELAAMVAELRSLDPKPAQSAQRAEITPIVPDLFLTVGRDGAWQIEVNHDTLPRVLVDRDYYVEVNRLARSKKERSFVEDCYRRASALARAVDRRARTLLAVAEEIVRRQDAYLREGGGPLRGLTLGEVAEPLELHVSTVSRAIANKYIATPSGLFTLRYFIGPSIPADRDQVAAEAVRQMIQELIAREKPEAVLSDQAILEILRSKGLTIARRTVAKYRIMLNIPSSAERRKRHRSGLRP